MNKTLILLIVLVTLCSLSSVNADEKDTSKSRVGENVLLYKPQYVNGGGLRNMMIMVLGTGGKDREVYFNSDLNLLMIKAPKESHEILLNLIKQYDIPSQQAILLTYILKASPGTKPDLEADKIIREAFGKTEGFGKDQKFRLISISSHLISLGGKKSRISFTLSNPEDNEGYMFDLRNIKNGEDTVTISTFELLKIEGIKKDSKANYKHQLINGAISLTFNKPTAIITGHSKEALVVILLIKKSPEK